MAFRELAVWVFLGGLTAGAQSSFEVASLKPSLPATGDTYRANLGTVRHGELEMTNVTLADMLRFAFTITNDQQIAGPDWIGNKRVRFDVLAKAAPGTPDDQVRLMLQTLLRERFKMEYHMEPRELSYLALCISKKGSKLTEAQEGTEPSGSKFWMGDIDTKRVSMQTLATVLSRFLREPILNETGLNGYYEVKLKWSPEPPPSVGNATGRVGLEATDAAGPSIFSAVQSQLGLQLESRKRKMDVIVIDHADQVPVGN